MEKLLRKTGINQSLRLLLIIASLVFGSSANVWAEDTVVDFSAGLPNDWTKTAGTVQKQKYAGATCLQLQKNATIQSPAYTTAFESMKLNIARSSKGTTMTLSYQIGTNAAVTIKTFSLSSSNAFSEQTVSLPAEAQVEGVKFILTSATASYYVSKITLTPKTTSGGGGETELTDRELTFGATTSFDAEVGGTFSAPTLTGVTDGVTYASSKEAVASVDAAGEVTINGMGHAKITASAEADATYKAGSASYDIYVYGKGTIEGLKAYITSTTETDIYFNLTTTAVVTGTDTSNAFMEDGSAGIYLYKNDHGLTAGNTYTGKVKAKGKLFKDSYELTEFIPANAASTADIPVTGWTIQDLTGSDNAGYKTTESMRVKLTGVTVTSDLANKMCTIEQDGYSTTLFLNQNAWTVTNGSTYNITGYPTIYNGTWEFKVIDEADLEATGESKTAATVTFAQESYSVQTNGEITVSATTNSNSQIVYSISPADGNVEIDENTGYIVAGNNAGTYTITATVAENKNFTSASASCPLTVTAPAPPSYNVAAPTYYKKITSTDELAAGGTYLIVCEDENCAIGSISDKKGQPTPITYTANNEKGINIISDIAQAAEYLLEKNSDGSFSLKNGTNYLKTNKADLSNVATVTEDAAKWTVSFNNGNVELVCKASDTRQIIYRAGTYNSFKNYATSSATTDEYKKVQLYQKVTDLAISTLTNGYATFVTDVPYVMPKGACGYAVTVAPHVGVITKTEAYTEGSQVPAQTALLIGGAPGTNYYPAVLKEDVTATYSGENYMEGRRTAEGYSNSQKGVAVYYYKLALNSASKPGFYYGAADGAAFQLTKPTTAYLAVPQSITPVNGYLIDFDGEETGISTIAPTNGNADGAIYNLNGIRMTQTLRNLPKGVYIVNGKKVIK